jgi:hypothetical protein
MIGLLMSTEDEIRKWEADFEREVNEEVADRAHSDLSVWTVHRASDNHCVGIYMDEARAASWCEGVLEGHYYYEHHEVIE